MEKKGGCAKPDFIGGRITNSNSAGGDKAKGCISRKRLPNTLRKRRVNRLRIKLSIGSKPTSGKKRGSRAVGQLWGGGKRKTTIDQKSLRANSRGGNLIGKEGRLIKKLRFRG